MLDGRALARKKTLHKQTKFVNNYFFYFFMEVYYFIVHTNLIIIGKMMQNKKLVINRSIDEVMHFVEKESHYNHNDFDLLRKHSSGIICWEFKRKRLFLSYIINTPKSIEIIREFKFIEKVNLTIVKSKYYYPRLLTLVFVIVLFCFIELDYKILNSLLSNNYQLVDFIKKIVLPEINFVILSLSISIIIFIGFQFVKGLGHKKIIEHFTKYVIEPLSF
jgi:hypothetical protein